jgi:hypothetical protein
MKINKGIWVLIILTVVMVVLGGVLAFLPAKKSPQTNPPVVVKGIQIISPTANQEVSSPLKITGKVNGNGWNGFEGQVGTVQLLDYKGNKVASGILTATTEWTQPEVSFETTLTFQTVVIGPMTLLFSNENPSGDPARQKTFTLPVTVK